MIGGVTDVNTAKMIARKLYMQYSTGGQMERMAMERMLVDTYKIMVRMEPSRIRAISPPRRTSTSTPIYSISTRMGGSVSRTLRGSPSSTWPGWRRGTLELS